MAMNEVPVGQISLKAYTKIKQNSYKAWPNEWGGLLVIEEGIVADIIILKHIADGASFEIDDDELAEFMIDLMENNPAKLVSIKGWVHCHPMMGWSGQDEATISRLLNTFGDFCVSIVDQHAKQLRFRIDFLTESGRAVQDDMLFEIVDGEVPPTERTDNMLVRC